jgi:hypothetical protein
MRSRTYRFTKKDPVCDELMSMVDQVGLRGKQHIGKIALLATKGYGTIEGILYGDTCRPQNATIMSIATALGFERKWVSGGAINIESELRDARAWPRMGPTKRNASPRRSERRVSPTFVS